MSPVLRLIVLCAAIAAMFAAFALGVPHSPQGLHHAVAGLGIAAPFVFVLAWAVLTPALASGTLLAIAAGLSFGVATGSLVGLAGATAGGMLAFMIARRGGRSSVDQLAGPRLRRVQERLERRGLLAVLLARMAPGVPATLLNYACGLSRVRLRDFVAGSVIGATPRIVAYAALGASGGHLLSAPALLGLGLIAVMALLPAWAAWRRRRPIAA
jgi:uncharacterized membrane protein YdjX (TVP38/TMEM64 family)